jgi:hypothetical protein
VELSDTSARGVRLVKLVKGVAATAHVDVM